MAGRQQQMLRTICKYTTYVFFKAFLKSSGVSRIAIQRVTWLHFHLINNT